MTLVLSVMRQVKKIEAHVVEFEALAFMQSPVVMDQVNVGRKAIRTDARLFSWSLGHLSFNFAFIASLRTSIPERKSRYRIKSRGEMLYIGSPQDQ